MGLYDIIKCNVELPGYNGPMDDFQTKDLENILFNYTITEEGRLVEHVITLVDVPEDEKKHKFHIWNTKPSHDRDYEFHGMLHFYTFDQNEGIINFHAKFTDGALVSIMNANTGAVKEYEYGNVRPRNNR